MNKRNPELLTHISQEVISLAYCCKITLVRGFIITLTDIDRDIYIDGTSYKAKPGLMVKLIEHSSGKSTAHIEILSESKIFSEEALAKGTFDGAQVEIFVVNYEDVSQGHIAMFSGMICEVTLQNGIFKVAIQGNINTLKNRTGNLFSPQCRAQFCDNACALDAAQYTFNSSISKVIDEFRIFQDVNLNANAGYYTHGMIKFLTGKNANFSSVVWGHTNQCLYLATSAPYGMLANDRYSVIAGCDKNFRTCAQKFDNVKNFRGEPHVPETRSIYKNLE